MFKNDPDKHSNSDIAEHSRYFAIIEQRKHHFRITINILYTNGSW